MKERPINFNSEMVRALLDGRKTQTRRPLKPAHGEQSRWLTLDNLHNFVESGEMRETGWQMWHPKDGPGSPYGFIKSPYGKPGDTLWVREKFFYDLDGHVLYRDPGGEWEFKSPDELKGKPSIHMPRWASRISLEITGVRVERIQDISEEDAETEGAKLACAECLEPFDVNQNAMGYCWVPDCQGSDFNHRAGFKNLWGSIYEKKGLGWEANPWVWIYEFKRIEP